jgi:hypothetical protein
MYNNCRKILLENSICKSLLQAVIASEMPTMLLFTHTAYIAAHFVPIYMNLELEFDNRRSVDQRVIALHGHRRVAGLIPSRVPIHVTAFCASGLDLF